jgi:hypothetical protein
MGNRRGVGVESVLGFLLGFEALAVEIRQLGERADFLRIGVRLDLLLQLGKGDLRILIAQGNEVVPPQKLQRARRGLRLFTGEVAERVAEVAVGFLAPRDIALLCAASQERRRQKERNKRYRLPR